MQLEPDTRPIYRISLELRDIQAYMDRMFPHAVILVNLELGKIFCNQTFSQHVGWKGSNELAELGAWLVMEWGDSIFRSLNSILQADHEVEMTSIVNLRSSSGFTIQSIAKCMKLIINEDQSWYLLHLTDVSPGPSYSILQHFAGTLMRDINLGVLLFDTQFTLIDISDTACHVLGLQRDAVVGRTMDEVFSLVPGEHRLVQRTIFDGNTIRNQAVSWSNGEHRYELLMDTNLLRDEQYRIVGGYVMFKDVTNLRSLEEQVQRSDRLAMIGQIAAGTAHEIRNPLTSIKGFLQVLRGTFVKSEMHKEQAYTNIMLMEIDRINELVSEFLLLSKRKHVQYDIVDVGVVLREILPIIENEATLHNMIVQYEPREWVPQIVADKELLKQVFLNIGKNGMEAMSEGGALTIQLRVDEPSRMVQVDIHDTGPGIPHFVMDKIFDPFFTTKEKGTGLGLSVCQRIIHDMGGDIRVSSKGFGTTFTVSIPFS